MPKWIPIMPKVSPCKSKWSDRSLKYNIVELDIRSLQTRHDVKGVSPWCTPLWNVLLFIINVPFQKTDNRIGTSNRGSPAYIYIYIYIFVCFCSYQVLRAFWFLNCLECSCQTLARSLRMTFMAVWSYRMGGSLRNAPMTSCVGKLNQ